MSPARKSRGKRKDEEPDEAEEEESQEDEEPDEEELEEQVEEAGGSSVSVDISEDRVVIDLPRDGNERKTLQELGKLLDGMS